MNPFVVWMPTIAAAAILTTAAYISMDEDPVEESRAEPAPDVYDAADAPPLTSDAEVDSAARDDDGGDILEIMENQLRMARRVSSSNKNSAPTKKGRRDLKALTNKAGYGLKKLTLMRDTVPDQTFARAEEIVKEIRALLEEINEAYKKYREERPGAPDPRPVAVPAEPVYQPAEPVYQPAEPVYESEQGDVTDEEDERPLI